MENDIPTQRDLEIQVLDAEIAVHAILQTPRLQPASIARLVALDEQIVARLRALDHSAASEAEEVANLRELHHRMLDTMRLISADGDEASGTDPLDFRKPFD